VIETVASQVLPTIGRTQATDLFFFLKNSYRKTPTFCQPDCGSDAADASTNDTDGQDRTTLFHVLDCNDYKSNKPNFLEVI